MLFLCPFSEGSDVYVYVFSSFFSREKVISFVGKSKDYVMSKIVNPLVESGTLKLAIPNKPNSPNQRYLKA